MHNERMPKQIVIVRMVGTKKRQRPQKRWTNEVEEDLKIMGIRKWHKMARGLEDGRRLFWKPRSTTGLVLEEEGRR
jgi:hypothetical protein